MNKCNTCKDYVNRLYYSNIITYCEKCNYIRCTFEQYLSLMHMIYMNNKYLITGKTKKVREIKKEIFLKECLTLPINNSPTQNRCNICLQNLYIGEKYGMKCYICFLDGIIYIDKGGIELMVNNIIQNLNKNKIKVYYYLIKSLFRKRKKNVKEQII